MNQEPLPAQGPVDVDVMPLDEQVKRLRAGNTALLEALMDMVNQFFYSKNRSGQYDEDGDILSHSFMSAEEGAIEVLIQAGMAEEVPGKGYRLLWDKLEARRPKQQTWEEAVRECITDPAEIERLLALSDDATVEEVHAAVKGHNAKVSGAGTASAGLPG